MKGSAAARASTPHAKGSFYKFLKPGALAKLRDSKMAERFQKQELLSQTALCDLLLSVTARIENDAPNLTDRMPCFSVRIGNRPRCLQRKKLIAVSPVFAESEQ